MSTLHDLFAATADDAPAPHALVTKAHALAERRRRAAARRRAGVALAGVVVAGGAVGASALRPDRPPVYVALGADGVVRVSSSPDGCRGGYSEPVPGRELPEAVRLVSTDPDLRQARPALARRMAARGCRTAGTALALSEAAPDGRLRRALTLSGPLPAPLPVGDDGSHEVSVRGVTGRVVVVAGRPNALTWQEPGGRSWVLQSTGQSEAELIAYADALRFGDDGTATLPDRLMHGFRDLGTQPERAGGTQHVWYLTYVNAAGREVEVEGSDERGPVGAFLAGVPTELVREVTVGGARGVYFTNGGAFGEGLQLLQFTPSPGVLASVSGVGLSLDELMELATSLTTAGPAHPAVVTSA